MDIYQELGVDTLINAAGTYTILGGSKMSSQTLQAMQQAAGSFVQIRDLQKAAHTKLAELTHNPAAYIANGAATAIYLCVAAAIEQRLGRPYYYLGREEIAQTNVVMFKAHRNPYDLVIGHLGAQYRELSFPNLIFPATERDLSMAIDEHTAAVYYAQCGWVAPGALSLEDTIRIAHQAGVPVLVDAAAQLPPVENLWRFTGMGADAVVFSGGKDLHGPQASGLVVGDRALLDRVSSIGFPNYGIGRMMKVGREEIAGLYTAVKQYLQLDHAARCAWCEGEIQKLRSALSGCPQYRVERRFPNEAGQPIPRAFVALTDPAEDPEALRAHMLSGSPAIFVNSDGEHGVYINPMSLEPGEMELVIQRLLAYAPSH